ncbi:MAG: hypothetical protein HKP42_08860 [Maribacter sp.]|nr:hypothetical protein [Maribacter sp.]MBT8301148.1 hypothetical protein [Maribacter sp.]NNK76161.1 hypothetical protein [Maribacter sp.]
MKNLRKFLLLTGLIIPFLTFAQIQEQKAIASINAVEITVDSIDELNSIDWNDMFLVFKENTSKDTIRIAINVKELYIDGTGSKHLKIEDFSIAVEGITENLEELEGKLQQSIESMTKDIQKMTEN